MKKQANPAPYERGSAILWVFIMIVLFASLTLMLNEGSRTGMTKVSDDRARLAVSDITGYGTALRGAIKQMQINGCKDTEISFDYGAGTSGYENADAPDDHSCDVFHPAGGGMQFMQQPDVASGPYRFTGAVCIPRVGSGGTACSDDSAADLLLILPIADESSCQRINDSLSIIGIPPDSETATYATPFTGAYAATDMPENTDNRTAACIQSNGKYYYYHVLIAR